MSYIKSLRFKLMLLCVVPTSIAAFLYIADALYISRYVEQAAAEAYLAAVSAPGVDPVQAVKGVTLELGWIPLQLVSIFVITFWIYYIPVTSTIKKIIFPIRQSAEYSNSLSKGDIHIDVVKNRTDEIGVLQESFQELVTSSRDQAELIERMAEGDISGSYTPRSPSDVVGHALVQMLDRNNNALSQVSAASKQITMASRQIVDGSQTLASGSTQQSASIEGLSASVNMITTAINDNREMAAKASDLSDVIRTNAEESGRQMAQMLDAVKEISNATQGIQKIIKAIEDIAFQTNILALNASVEAARAGQHGKGFSVVAEEVRNLATKSSEAASDSGKLISNSIEKTGLGVRIADETAESLNRILSGVGESGSIIKEMAKSAEDQASSIIQINDSIGQISSVVHQNSATAEELAAASEEMNGQAETLEQLVSMFKLKGIFGSGSQGAALTSSPHRDGMALS